MDENLKGSTQEWVDKVKDTQEKDERNRKRGGDGHPESPLPNKQH